MAKDLLVVDHSALIPVDTFLRFFGRPIEVGTTAVVCVPIIAGHTQNTRRHTHTFDSNHLRSTTQPSTHPHQTKQSLPVETTTLGDVLAIFRKGRTHMVVLTSELARSASQQGSMAENAATVKRSHKPVARGAIVGIITLTDVLQKILGMTILDEKDKVCGWEWWLVMRDVCLSLRFGCVSLFTFSTYTYIPMQRHRT